MAPAPAGFAEIERAEMARALGVLLYVRLAALPITVGVILWHWHLGGQSPVRLAIICAFVAAGLTYLAFQFRLRQRGAINPGTFGAGVLGAAILVLGIAALTGGLQSPFLLILPISAALNAMAGGRRQAFIAVAIEFAVLPLLALIGGASPPFIAALVLFILLAMQIGLTMREMYERMLGRMLQARDDLLQLHAEQLRDLTALSGEIAHELKTPLSSIKGLTGLAILELQEPVRAAERLEVLRKEALRMQKLLEEFLDFSRPISPLVLERIDALQIAEEVTVLFEGLAHDRELTLSLSGSPAELRCDPRKIKQLLINLVQNAVEASAPGGEMRIEVDGEGAEAKLRVLDRGRGLLPEVAQRVFQAGVTTKERGSGLGLTIARSIAQQHGGRLSLGPRPGGGCIAELVLPRGVDSALREEKAA
ncbi:MAG TPA: HAMP domain-containing sensor histidine kinase [Myxococcales bacterium]|nr:HAMP domain-containing sensor histidine kinase [Myxococcales bacterium]